MGRASRKRRALGFRARPVPMPTPAEPAARHSRILGPDAWRGLNELAVLYEERLVVESTIEALAVRLAELGVSWGEIGRALGVSRQGARQRYGSQPAATTVVVSKETSV